MGHGSRIGADEAVIWLRRSQQGFIYDVKAAGSMFLIDSTYKNLHVFSFTHNIFSKSWLLPDIIHSQDYHKHDPQRQKATILKGGEKSEGRRV